MTGFKKRVQLPRPTMLAASLLLIVTLTASASFAEVVTETWDGEKGADWPAQWTVTAGDNAVSIQDNGGNVQQVDPVAARTTIALINTATFTDSVQTVDVKIKKSTYLSAGVLARVNEEADSFYAAVLEWPNASKSWKIFIRKYVDGTVTTLGAPVDVTASETEFSTLSFSVKTAGDAVELKLTYTDPAGTASTLEATDGSPLPAPGKVGLRATTHSNTARFVRFDNYKAE